MANKVRDMRRRLVTPEGIDLGVVIGDSGQRIGAFLLDMLVMLAAMIAPARVLMSFMVVISLWVERLPRVSCAILLAGQILPDVKAAAG